MITSRATRHVVHLMHGDRFIEPNRPLPTLERDELASLSQFVQGVWTTTPDWLQLPDDEFVLRALPTYSIHGDICFDLRNAQHPGIVRRFLYERARGLLIVERSHLVGDGSEVGGGKADPFFTESALRIIAAYEQGPADSDPDRRVEFHASFALDHVPRYTGISDLAHRVADHWFASVQQNWGWARKFLFTLAGSSTFFLFWFVYAFVVAQASDYIEFNLLIAIILGLSILGPLWFASLTAWPKLHYGPIRLFLSGFLLPYFIWTLVAFMYEREAPTFLNARGSTSVDSSDQHSSRTATDEALEKIITPQEPEQQ